MGIKLVEERTGQPIGAGMCFVRDLAHILDGFFYLGYLWPLWDNKRQTFADKILTTVVVETAQELTARGCWSGTLAQGGDHEDEEHPHDGAHDTGDRRPHRELLCLG